MGTSVRPCWAVKAGLIRNKGRKEFIRQWTNWLELVGYVFSVQLAALALRRCTRRGEEAEGELLDRKKHDGDGSRGGGGGSDTNVSGGTGTGGGKAGGGGEEIVLSDDALTSVIASAKYEAGCSTESTSLFSLLSSSVFSFTFQLTPFGP